MRDTTVALLCSRILRNVCPIHASLSCYTLRASADILTMAFYIQSASAVLGEGAGNRLLRRRPVLLTHRAISNNITSSTPMGIRYLAEGMTLFVNAGVSSSFVPSYPHIRESF